MALSPCPGHVPPLCMNGHGLCHSLPPSPTPFSLWACCSLSLESPSLHPLAELSSTWAMPLLTSLPLAASQAALTWSRVRPPGPKPGRATQLQGAPLPGSAGPTLQVPKSLRRCWPHSQPWGVRGPHTGVWLCSGKMVQRHEDPLCGRARLRISKRRPLILPCSERALQKRASASTEPPWEAGTFVFLQGFLPEKGLPPGAWHLPGLGHEGERASCRPRGQALAR